MSYNLGLDTYTQTNSNRIAPGGAIKQVWQNGMMSDNTLRFRYISHNFMSNMNKQFGKFDVNLMLGASIEDTSTDRQSMMAYNFSVPNFFSYANATDNNKDFAPVIPNAGQPNFPKMRI